MKKLAKPSAALTELASNLWVLHGHINVGIVVDGDRALLIDSGDGSVAGAFGEIGVKRVDTILFTHHHRDQTCGAHAFAGAKIGVPKVESALFADPRSYWNSPTSRWHIYDFHPHRLTLTEPVVPGLVLENGDTFEWGSARISAVAAPGHTNGSLAYLVEIADARVAFTGDLVYDEGRIWDLHSLQKGGETSDYHGYLGALDELEGSLSRVLDLRPDALLPSHGNVMRDPSAAVGKLIERLGACRDSFREITAMRYYWPQMFERDRVAGQEMPISGGTEPPGFLRHVGTSWVIVSESGAAFVMDCGSPEAVQSLKDWMSSGEISSVDALWITHYHDDHVDAVPEMLGAFPCEVIADEWVAKVISDPLAWRLPCISPAKVPVGRVTRTGDTWQWREFVMTAFHFPGQTLYHGALLVEGRGLRLFFIGDSYTPSGIDDYCMHNRNSLAPGTGYDYCIRLTRDLDPDMMLNPHVAVWFRFGDEQLEFMLDNLTRREELHRALSPWPHPDYLTDESWVRCAPYEQRARAGGTVRLEAIATNHSPTAQRFAARLVSPREWRMPGATMAETTVPARADGAVILGLSIPAGVQPGKYVLPLDVEFSDFVMPQITEAVVVVQ